uniref:recombinase family protein n=1 Tax=Aeromonas caviae TaxID=648 RepID=UPI0035A25FBD
SGARADRPELLRMVADLQAGETVVAEKIDRISRLPLARMESTSFSASAKGRRLMRSIFSATTVSPACRSAT